MTKRASESDYWDVIQPYWETVSIYDGPEIFLRDFLKMPVPAQHLFAAHWLQSEVNNGGFGQFCYNSTGILAPEARDAFMVLGMPKVAVLVEQYLAFWGTVYPREQGEREALWEQLSIERYGIDSDGEPLGGDFEDISDVFFDLIDDENGGFEHAANTYAAKSKTSS